jgi:hypothetical protein
MALCFVPEDEEKLARGWPHVIVPIDGHKTDKAAGKAAMKAHVASDPIYFAEWPRLVLMRYLRIEAAALSARQTTYDERMAEVHELAPTASEDATSLSAEEGIAAVRRMYEQSDEIYPFQSHAFVYGVESITDTDAVLDALTLAVAGGSSKQTNAKTAMIETLAFLLLRATPAVAKGARAKLEQAHETLAAQGNPKSEMTAALDLSLHATDAVRRGAGKFVELEGEWGLGGYTPLEFADDAAYVREQVPRAKANAPMSVRIAWLGGRAVLAGLASRKWAAARMPSIVRDFGMIRAPEVVELMLSLIGKASVKDGPINWFKAHADYARPILAKSKAVAAKGVLRQLG